MKVPLSAPDITTRERELVLEVLDSPVLSIGPKASLFERMIAGYVGVKYGIAVNSGTSGLHLLVRALNIGDGDEVITTPFSFVASANCLLFERARPVFVDIDPATLNINPGGIEKKITGRTRAILPVHVFGRPADMEAILDIARRRRLAVIEDACEALGACYNGKMAGSEGDAAVFAFYPNKQITTGEGGVIVTSSEEVAKLCRSMRNQGRGEGGEWFDHCRLGYNYRMSELNAALGVAQMERIDQILARRGEVAAKYGARLKNLPGVSIPQAGAGEKISWFVYVIRLAEGINRDGVMKFLQEQGVECRPYFQPIHLQPFYVKMFGCRKGNFPETEKAALSTLALPFFNNLTDTQMDYVAEKLALAVSRFNKRRQDLTCFYRKLNKSS
ncbi:MAG: DegT/DnrJ/EryC1/StrS family aminotransferase [Peptococcaceae bacterium]|nr:MAG: DegT/DnrJ/EryC1/StrS family aminotransferase [Peptococcaceae bacterium]